MLRAYLATAPVWVQSVFMGVFFGVSMTLWPAGSGGSWIGRILGGVVGGALFGFFMGRFVKREFGAIRSELADLPPDQRRAAMRAAGRGPAPADPVVREAALQCAKHRRDLVERRWRFNNTVFAVALALYAVMALTRSPWWWAAFAMFAAFLVGQLRSPHRVERRIAVLSDGTPAAAA